MGSAHSSRGILSPAPRAYCESNSDPFYGSGAAAPPPTLRKVETNEEKMYRKFRQQPLVPIGCAATAYFLISGIRSFQKRDPVRSQKMMKYRVAAQFVTLICFIGYLGVERLDFRVAPMYQDAKKGQKEDDRN
ncbi:hypothetical protein MPSEU_000404500 [Mayamaea pseudoterrestris]|nr:hypothetical protein MPSEU_000404500 [Mayamaea pseudoterrestris]